ncbi:hypothetical protein EDC04DRAFT_2669073, partial [Pisolithus marmoratus]
NICHLTVLLMLKTGPVSNCTLVTMGLVGLQVISSAAASFLFLNMSMLSTMTIRLSNTFSASCGLSESALLVQCSPVPYMITMKLQTPNTVQNQGWTTLSVAFMDPALFDTLVYFAIMYKILSTHQNGQKKTWRTFCSGNGLSHFSCAMFWGGQQNYLITTGA